MPDESYVKCEICGGTGRVALIPQPRMRTADDLKSCPRAHARSIPRWYRSGRLDLFALAKKRERLEKDVRSAYKCIKVAMEQIAELTREMARIQERIEEDDQRRAGAGQAAKSASRAGG